MKKIDLSKVSERDQLRAKANRMPYWHRLEPGCFVGYRPASGNGAGNWVARAYVNSKETQQPLGAFGEFPANERWGRAKAATQAYIALIKSGGRAQVQAVTVADAARNYVTAGHASAEAYFQLSVYEDPIGEIKLSKLRHADLKAWRERLAARAVHKGNGRERAPASINREMAPLRAALYEALPPGAPKTESAWQDAIKPISAKIAVRRRTLTLDRDQRRVLRDNTSAEAKPFVHSLCLLPVRPGAMSKLVVADFDKKTCVLTIRGGIDKGHALRNIPVSAAAAELLIAQSKNKLPGAPLFMRANGKAWDRDSWKKPIRAAAVAAKLSPQVCAYTLRHSLITDLVNAGIPTLTVAQISGTSVKQIEDHYGHLLQHAAVKALDALAL